MKFLLFLALSTFYAQAGTFKIKSAEIDFYAPYTFGKHEGKANGLIGQFSDSGAGKFSIPIKNLKTGNEEMDCHLYESLGLNYEISNFPDEHVCEDDKLPKTGKNSIIYPNISFQVKKAKLLSENENNKTFELMGHLEIHGQKNFQRWTVAMEKINDVWVSKHKIGIDLKEYGVTVKNFLFIKVDGDVTVNLKINWEQE